MTRWLRSFPAVIFFLALCALFIGALAAAPAFCADFEGDWVGHFRNSRGDSGEEKLELHSTEHGALRGRWSGDVRVHGERTGDRSLHLTGESGDVSYDITGELRHGELHIHYYATRHNGNNYEGWEELHRR